MTANANTKCDRNYYDRKRKYNLQPQTQIPEIDFRKSIIFKIPP